MTTSEIYQLAIKLGKEHDLRGLEKVEKYLQKINKQYQELTPQKQVEFDQELLTNPYSDSRLLVDNHKGEIKKILTGIDIGGAELLLADKLGVDLVISHHPLGKGLANLHGVMALQAQVLANYGVPINIAEGVNRQRISAVSRTTAPINHNRSVDLAKLLNLDLMCTHTIADNMAAQFVIDILEKNKAELDTVGDVLELLKTIPEYKQAIKNSAGPRIFAGQAENSCGKVVVTEFTGGTSGAKEIYEKMAQAGIGTIISMHMGEEYRSEAEKYHLNVIVAGHMASDSIGMNLFLDNLESKGIKIIPVSGLIRIQR